MAKINIVAATTDSTVISEYTPELKKSTAYQSEAALEAQFIKMLQAQSYEYVDIHEEKDLIENLRKQIELLNDVKFNDDEWKKFFEKNLSNSNLDKIGKTITIQEDHIKPFIFENGEMANIALLDKKDIYNNRLQVINQYVNNDGKRDNRYDVTILVNGLPLVHVELKRRGASLKEAFNQIKRYDRDSFWASSGLFDFIQIFVISNGTYTKYYSNTTRQAHVDESTKNISGFGKKTSNSFEFTSYWADAKNKIIPDLVDFTKTFLAKGTILNILTKYCILDVDRNLLVMRPYQIVATEKILQRIEQSNNYKTYGSTKGGGYIWHTTGSGKTLTSFKTAQLATRLPYIDKVIFVVDRKDLDYQTMREYDKFEKGAANGNKSTTILKRQLEDIDEKGNHHDYQIIVTTIQKLDSFVKNNPSHPIYNKRVVLIFDECHRSQFGDMHEAILGYEGNGEVKGKRGAFKKYNLFGFTGTPIFAENSGAGNKLILRTTEQAFGDRLHTYTIVDAINDENVLPFRIDYVPTMKEKDEEKIEDKQVKAIDREKAFNDPDRIALVSKYILDHFDQQTKRNDKYYTFSKLLNISEVAKAKDKNSVIEKKAQTIAKGFNSIFAVSSIPAAIMYYDELKKQMDKMDKHYKIAMIYSFGANDDPIEGIIEDENSDTTEGLDQTSRDFLDQAIKDYCKMFNIKGAYDTSSEKFPNYYKDVSLRMKNREIDLLIVVNMFLTGFDATTLNTLWVDKNLKHHGLIQAFSRTNRILNSVKKYGNIVCFRRKLRTATDEALSIFGDKEAKGIVLLKTFEEYYRGYTDEKGKHKGYIDLINEITTLFPVGTQPFGETKEKEFIKLFGQILRLKNILSAFDDFDGKEIISDYDFQDYTGTYLTLHEKWRPRINEDKEIINDDIEFEIGLVQQVEVNIDYILILVAKYHDTNCKDKSILGVIDKAIDSSTQLRSKKDLIKEFIGDVETGVADVNKWDEFVHGKAGKELKDIIDSNKLKESETLRLMENAFKDGVLKTTGTDIDKVMPPISRFGNSNRVETKKSIITKLLEFFEKFFGIIQ